MSELWWCVAAIPLIGMLNLGVSFYFAFRMALRAAWAGPTGCASGAQFWRA